MGSEWGTVGRNKVTSEMTMAAIADAIGEDFALANVKE
jgi:hypothetical protein